MVSALARSEQEMLDCAAMPDGTPNRATMLVLAYLWPLAIIPLLLAKDDAEVQWHARHGLVLMGAELTIFLALAVISTVFTAVTMAVAFLMTLVFLCLWAGVFILHLVAIVRALTGTRLVIPVVSEYAARF
jgi:uncharacterized membrane protein